MSESGPGRPSSDSNGDDKEFSCDYCGDQFVSQVTKRRHERNYHADELPVECPDCGKPFHDRDGMVSHHSQKHDGRLAGYDKVCGVCGTEFTTSKQGMEYCSPGCGTEAQKERVIIECERCGDEIETTPSVAESKRFCSMDCKTDWFSEWISGENHPLWKDNTTTKTCAYCGESVEMPNVELEKRDHNRAYCSKVCAYKWRSENIRGENHPLYKDSEVACEWCGETFQKRPAKVDAHEKNFCSRSCHGKWLSKHNVGKAHPRHNGGTVNYYGPNWYRQKRKALKRDQYRCCECGRTERELGQRPSVHHRVKIKYYKRNFDAPEWYEKGNRLSNLITLCEKHHGKWEPLPVQPYPE